MTRWIGRFRAWFAAVMALILVGAVLSSEAMAQNRPRPIPPPAERAAPGKVTVKLLVVAATDSHEGVDPRLRSLAAHLGFLRYKGFDLLDTHEAEVGPGGDTTFFIVGGRRVNVALLQRTNERAQFRVQVFSQQGKLLDTTLSVNRNGTFIVAGPRHGDGILILPLQAQY